MKEKICAAAGVFGSALAGLFGPWSSDLTALLVCMAVDLLSGSAVALIFHKSSKTPSGAYSSAYGFKGLCKKVMLLSMVSIGHRMDLALGTEFIRTGVCAGFLVNEMLSVMENAGLMGIPIPNVLKRALDILQQKHEQ